MDDLEWKKAKMRRVAEEAAKYAGVSTDTGVLPGSPYTHAGGGGGGAEGDYGDPAAYQPIKPIPTREPGPTSMASGLLPFTESQSAYDPANKTPMDKTVPEGGLSKILNALEGGAGEYFHGAGDLFDAVAAPALYAGRKVGKGINNAFGGVLFGGTPSQKTSDEEGAVKDILSPFSRISSRMSGDLSDEPNQREGLTKTVIGESMEAGRLAADPSASPGERLLGGVGTLAGAGSVLLSGGVPGGVNPGRYTSNAVDASNVRRILASEKVIPNPSLDDLLTTNKVTEPLSRPIGFDRRGGLFVKNPSLDLSTKELYIEKAANNITKRFKKLADEGKLDKFSDDTVDAIVEASREDIADALRSKGNNPDLRAAIGEVYGASPGDITRDIKRLGQEGESGTETPSKLALSRIEGEPSVESILSGIDEEGIDLAKLDEMPLTPEDEKLISGILGGTPSPVASIADDAVKLYDTLHMNSRPEVAKLFEEFSDMNAAGVRAVADALGIKGFNKSSSKPKILAEIYKRFDSRIASAERTMPIKTGMGSVPDEVAEANWQRIAQEQASPLAKRDAKVIEKELIEADSLTDLDKKLRLQDEYTSAKKAEEAESFANPRTDVSFSSSPDDPQLTEVLSGGKPIGSIRAGDDTGFKSASRKLFRIPKDDKVVRLFDIELSDEALRGQGVGREMWRKLFASNPDAWVGSSQLGFPGERSAVRSLESISNAGMIDLKWSGGKGGQWVAKLTDQGKAWAGKPFGSDEIKRILNSPDEVAQPVATNVSPAQEVQYGKQSEGQQAVGQATGVGTEAEGIQQGSTQAFSRPGTERPTTEDGLTVADTGRQDAIFRGNAAAQLPESPTFNTTMPGMNKYFSMGRKPVNKSNAKGPQFGPVKDDRAPQGPDNLIGPRPDDRPPQGPVTDNRPMQGQFIGPARDNRPIHGPKDTRAEATPWTENPHVMNKEFSVGRGTAFLDSDNQMERLLREVKHAIKRGKKDPLRVPEPEAIQAVMEADARVKTVIKQADAWYSEIGEAVTEAQRQLLGSNIRRTDEALNLKGFVPHPDNPNAMFTRMSAMTDDALGGAFASIKPMNLAQGNFIDSYKTALQYAGHRAMESGVIMRDAKGVPHYFHGGGDASRMLRKYNPDTLNRINNDTRFADEVWDEVLKLSENTGITHADAQSMMKGLKQRIDKGEAFEIERQIPAWPDQVKTKSFGVVPLNDFVHHVIPTRGYAGSGLGNVIKGQLQRSAVVREFGTLGAEAPFKNLIEMPGGLREKIGRVSDRAADEFDRLIAAVSNNREAAGYFTKQQNYNSNALGKGLKTFTQFAADIATSMAGLKSIGQPFEIAAEMPGGFLARKGELVKVIADTARGLMGQSLSRVGLKGIGKHIAPDYRATVAKYGLPVEDFASATLSSLPGFSREVNNLTKTENFIRGVSDPISAAGRLMADVVAGNNELASVMSATRQGDKYIDMAVKGNLTLKDFNRLTNNSMSNESIAWLKGLKGAKKIDEAEAHEFIRELGSNIAQRMQKRLANPAFNTKFTNDPLLRDQIKFMNYQFTAWRTTEDTVKLVRAAIKSSAPLKEKVGAISNAIGSMGTRLLGTAAGGGIALYVANKMMDRKESDLAKEGFLGQMIANIGAANIFGTAGIVGDMALQSTGVPRKYATRGGKEDRTSGPDEMVFTGSVAKSAVNLVAALAGYPVAKIGEELGVKTKKDPEKLVQKAASGTLGSLNKALLRLGAGKETSDAILGQKPGQGGKRKASDALGLLGGKKSGGGLVAPATKPGGSKRKASEALQLLK